MLNRLRAGLHTNVRKKRFAGAAIEAGGAKLDQLVGLEAALDFVKNPRRQSRGADQHDRLEGVRASFQLAPSNGR